MLKKTGGVLALVSLGALSLMLVNCGSSSSRPTGLLYVLSQEQSNVSSYAVDLGSGNLSLIKSNTPTGGIPLQISLGPTAAMAFVLNQESISGYTVNSDGSLSTPATTDLAAGRTAVAMTPDKAGDLLFVVDQGPVAVPTDCPDQNGIFGSDCPSISVFSTSSATVTPVSQFLLGRVPTSVSAITYTPSGGSAQTVLFVTSNKDLTANRNDNELSVYVVDSSGNLTEAPNSPYTTQVNPTVVQAVNTSAAGQGTPTIFVYVGNSGPQAGGVSAFELCTEVDADCTQPEVDSHLLRSVDSTSSVGQNPVAMLVDPTNAFLYIACKGANQVYAFSMGSSTGKLTALNPALQPTGAQPVALAMHGSTNSSTEFLYVSNNGSSNITGWPVLATTGSLGSPISVLFPPGAPSGMAGR